MEVYMEILTLTARIALAVITMGIVLLEIFLGGI
jgi:hypothetical protein